jgi:hypothetical protein
MEAPPHASGQIEFRITERDMAAFRKFSGGEGISRKTKDVNIVYGGLIVAQVSRLLSARLPGQRCVWRSLALTFHAPLHVNETATLTAAITHVNEEHGLIDFTLRIDVATHCIAEGEAAALLIYTPPHLPRAAA